MTIQEFFKLVPLENGTKVMLMGNGFFNGLPISNGTFTMVDKSYILNLDRDYELLNVSAIDNRLCLSVDCI